MAKRSRVTPFGEWLTRNGYQPYQFQQLADTLGCTDGSIRHYARGKAIPRPAMLAKLRKLTGLSSDAFLYPFEQQ